MASMWTFEEKTIFEGVGSLHWSTSDQPSGIEFERWVVALPACRARYIEYGN